MSTVSCGSVGDSEHGGPGAPSGLSDAVGDLDPREVGIGDQLVRRDNSISRKLCVLYSITTRYHSIGSAAAVECLCIKRLVGSPHRASSQTS